MSQTESVLVHLPSSLTSLFEGMPRKVDLEASSVKELIDLLNERWPGTRDRLCSGNAVRKHINIFVNEERSTLSASLQPGATVHIIPAVSGGYS